MNENEKADLIKRYEDMPDELLLKRFAEGEANYNEAAWSVILSEIQRRKIETNKLNEVVAESAKGEDLKGVGGWLMLFILGGFVFSPLRFLAILVSSPMTTFSKIIIGGFLVWRFYVCWLLFKVKPKAVRSTRIYLRAFFIGDLLILIWNALYLSISKNIETAHFGVGDIGALIATVVWYQYFKVSKRVRSTFSDEFTENKTLPEGR